VSVTELNEGGLPNFDGDWLRLVTNLKLAGMAGMLAMHCELKSLVGRRVELSVPAEHKHLAEKSFIDKLQNALANYFGTNISVAVTIGEASGNTLAEVEERGRQTKQADAIAAIEQDMFVQDLVERLDARLIESSIRPVQQ
jgi:DNA polymerase-3 subunit gamma/tau